MTELGGAWRDRRDVRACLVIAGAALVAMFVLPVHAGAHSPHDDIDDIAVSPSYAEDQTIFIVSRDVLQRSSDAGETWQDLVVGLGRAQLVRIAISPADEDLVFVSSRGEGLYRSNDGGSTWSTANTGLGDLSLGEVAASPDSKDLVFVAGTAGGLYRSIDSGDTWSVVPVVGRVTALTFLDDGSGRVLAGDATGRIWVSDDDGETWTESVPVPGAGAITAFTTGAAAGSASMVIATTADGHVVRSTDGGTSFRIVGDQVPGGEPRGIAMSPDDVQDLWISAADEGAFRSTDGGESWEAQPDGLTKSEQADDVDVAHFRAIRVADGADEDALFLGGFDGLFRSDDGGEQWHPIETQGDPISGLAVSPDFANDQTVVVMTYVKGGFISDDGGQTWRTMNDGLHFDGLSEGNRLLPLRRAHNVVFSPSYADDGTIFSATWPQLIKSVDAGETWTQVQIEQPTEDWSPLRQYVLAVSPDFAADRTVFAGNRHGQIFRSEGAGDAGTWSEVATVDGRVRTFAISPSFAADNTVFVSSVGGVFMSEDGGSTWRATGPGRSPLANGSETDPAPLLAISPGFAADRTVFAGTESGLYVTRDGGDSWDEVVSGPISDAADVAAVGLSPDFAADGTMLVSVRNEGLYRSTDGGATFAPVGAELAESNRVISDYDNPTSSPIQFSASFATDDTVFAYAGPDVLRSTDGGETWDVLTLPTIDDVADSLGVEVDALSHASHSAPASDSDGGRRTFDTPVGVLSLRRLGAAVMVAGLVTLAVARLGPGRSWRPAPRWGLRVGVFIVVFAVAAALVAA
ncbi:MAG: hypothetical protein ABWZ52_08185 [Acidimicrobiales bacterium]